MDAPSSATPTMWARKKLSNEQLQRLVLREAYLWCIGSGAVSVMSRPLQLHQLHQPEAPAAFSGSEGSLDMCLALQQAPASSAKTQQQTTPSSKCKSTQHRKRGEGAEQSQGKPFGTHRARSCHHAGPLGARGAHHQRRHHDGSPPVERPLETIMASGRKNAHIHTHTHIEFLIVWVPSGVPSRTHQNRPCPHPWGGLRGALGEPSQHPKSIF